MDLTKKLLMSVTASALLVGSGGMDPGFTTAQSGPKNSNAPQEDPEVTEAAQAIYSLLKNLSPQTAMSLADIMHEESDMKRAVAEKAIKKLMRSGKIRRIGSDSKDDPYRYYDRPGFSG